METNGQHLAENYLAMLNTHEPDLVDRFVAEAYRNHNAFVADGREANRQFWTAFFTALPDLSATMEDLVISGDRVVGRFVYRGTHTGEFMGDPRQRQPGGDALHRHLARRGRHVRRTLGRTEPAGDVPADGRPAAPRRRP